MALAARAMLVRCAAPLASWPRNKSALPPSAITIVEPRGSVISVKLGQRVMLRIDGDQTKRMITSGLPNRFGTTLPLGR